MRTFKETGVTEEECIAKLIETTDCEIEKFFYKFIKSEESIEIEAIKVDETASYGSALLKVFLKNFNLEGTVETKIRDNQINYLIHSTNNSILIGKKGHILDSLHKYLRQAIYTETNIYPQVILDVEGYKEKQIYYLEQDAKKIAKEVKETKIEVRMDPMNSYDRKIIHTILTDFKNIETESAGEEPNRYVVIKYKED